MGKEVFEKTKSIDKRSKSIIFFSKRSHKNIIFLYQEIFPVKSLKLLLKGKE